MKNEIESAISRVNIRFRYWRKTRAKLYEIRRIILLAEEDKVPLTHKLKCMITDAIFLTEPPIDGSNITKLNSLIHKIRVEYCEEAYK